MERGCDLPEVHVFDLPHYRRLDESRLNFLREILPDWKQHMGLCTALDVGCGLGHFSALLKQLGLEVTGLDGRRQNVEEAERRAPGVRFHLADVEDPAVRCHGSYDLVLCLGLLYHLENPFQAIRNLRELTSRVMVIESMCIDEEEPVLHLREEDPSEDQGLRHIAFYPTEACLVKMLYRVGFPQVHRFARLPDHPDFRATRERRRVRTMLVASLVPMECEILLPVAESAGVADPWTTDWAKVLQAAHCVGNFIAKPWPEKMATLRRRMGWNEK